MHSTRRGFLHSAGLTGLGSAGLAAAKRAQPAAAFYGPHQAGIGTPAQNFLQFAALDMVSDSVTDLRALMVKWSAAAALAMAGKPVGPVASVAQPATDTGEALGLPAANLTITFGFGPGLFGVSAADRFGLAARRPKPLVTLPTFRGDALRAPISGGDLAIQVCGNDPQVVFHAVHDLIKLATPTARARWLLAGAGRTGTSDKQATPRNLMGFFDGTANITVESTAAMKKFVWAAAPASPSWMTGGSYLVARRIEIGLGTWDSASVTEQERTIGRRKVTGDLLGDLPGHAHVLLASPALNGQQRILRRGYSYVDGLGAGGAPGTGLMFLCYQADPRHQFIPIQRRLAAADSLNRFVTHIGSAIFACPPGASSAGYVGEGLLG